MGTSGRKLNTRSWIVESFPSPTSQKAYICGGLIEIQNECKANTKQYLRQVNTALLLAVEAFILNVVAARRWAEWTKDVRATDPV